MNSAPKHEADLAKLVSLIRSYKNLVVAFSGGVDSAFLLQIAAETLGHTNIKAVTAVSDSLSSDDYTNARETTIVLKIPHEIIRTQELENPNYATNPINRCFFCKDELYGKLTHFAQTVDFQKVACGINADDLSDYRPGIEAARIHGIEMPLADSGFGKEDIRKHAKLRGLPVWDKPASPCLSSRIPYGSWVTREKLRQIEIGESFLRSLHLRIFRVRHFGDMARVELDSSDMKVLCDETIREKIKTFLTKKAGFLEVTFDIYQSGRLNRDAGIQIPN